MRSRLLSKQHPAGIDGMHFNLLRSTVWASQQKPCVTTGYIKAVHRKDDERLAAFDRVLRALPPRLAVAEKPIKVRKGRKATTIDVDNEWFSAHSVCRPHFADNLAVGRRFYDGLARLLSDRDVREKVGYEQACLRDLVAAETNRDTKKKGTLLNDDEPDFIRAVQMARGKIKVETMGQNNRHAANQATKNRWNA